MKMELIKVKIYQKPNITDWIMTILFFIFLLFFMAIGYAVKETYDAKEQYISNMGNGRLADSSNHKTKIFPENNKGKERRAIK